MEQWKPIPEFPGYEVSNLARVKSHWTPGRTEAPLDKAGHIIKNYKLKKDGRVVVTLYYNGRGASRTVARLVARAFVPNPNGYYFVACRDGNPEHVQPENLEWVRRPY